MKSFSLWVESRQAEEIKDAIVSKLRSDMGLTDDDEILQLKTADLSSDAKEQILKLGPVQDRIDPSKTDQVRDLMDHPDTTVGTLIDNINGDQMAPQPKFGQQKLDTNPAMQPQQSQNLGGL